DRSHLLRRDALVVATLLKRIRDAGRCLEAEVGLDQQILELVQRGSVELPLCEDARDAFGELAGSLAQARLEPIEPPDLGLRRFLLDRRRLGNMSRLLIR